MLTTECQTCESCEDTINAINNALIRIVDKRLYNIRYELNREVDYGLFKLLTFYKQVVQDICDEVDCDCYTAGQCSTVSTDEVNTGIQPATVNHCVCGCCPPLNVVCNVVPCASTLCSPGCDSVGVSTALTKENILERAKILSA